MPSRARFTAYFASLLLMFMQSQAVPAQQAKASMLAGCVSGEPGNYTLGAVPSGNLYRLQGNTAALVGYNNHLIRVTGSETAPASSRQTGAFAVQKVQVIADSCTAPMPPQNAQATEAVAGKAAERADALNTSTTQSVTQNTPGVQTEAGTVQQPGKPASGAAGEQNQPAQRGPLAPPAWGQTGESPQAGNADAAAAQRAEEEPGHTLGVNAMPSYDNPNQAQGKAATQETKPGTKKQGQSKPQNQQQNQKAANPQ